MTSPSDTEQMASFASCTPTVSAAQVVPFLELATQICSVDTAVFIEHPTCPDVQPIIYSIRSAQPAFDATYWKETFTRSSDVHRAVLLPPQPFNGYIGVKICTTDQQPWAVLAVYTTPTHTLNVEQIQHLQSLAKTITSVLQPVAPQTQTSPPNIMEQMLHGLQFGVLVEDHNGFITHINQTLCAMFQIVSPSTDLIGTSFFEFINQIKPLLGDAERFIADITQATIRNQAVSHTEMRLVDGRVYSYDYVPIMIDADVQQHVWCFHDITTIQQQQQQLIQHNHYLGTLHKTILGVVGHLNSDEVVQQLVDQACTLFAAAAGYLFLFDAAANAYVLRVYIDPHDAKHIVPIIGLDQGLVGKVARQRQPIVIDDYEQWNERIAQSTGLKATMGVPLMNRDDVVGVLLIASTMPRRFSTAEAEVLQQYAQLAVIALENARLYTAAEQELNERRIVEKTLAYNRQLLQDFLDNARDLIQITNIQGEFIFTNEAWRSTLGYSDVDLQGLNLFDLTHPDQRSAAEACFTALNNGEQNVTLETVLVARNGSEIYVDGNLNGRVVDGELVAVRGILRDVTERRCKDAQLREQARNDHMMISALNHGVILQNEQGQVLQWNASAEHILGLNGEQLQGSISLDSMWHAIHPDGSPFPYSDHPSMHTLHTGEASHNVVMGIYKPDGSLTWISISTQPLMNAHQQLPYGVVCSFHEITAQRAAEQAIIQAKEAAEHASRAKSQFLASMSHEFRTPLNAIIGYSELVLEQLGEQHIDIGYADVQHIAYAGQHLLKLVNDLLDLAKIESEQQQLVLDWASLDEVISAVSEIATLLMDKHANTLVVEPVPDILIYADQFRLQQILLNILSNASKFTNQGVVTIAAALVEVQERQWIDIRINDTGIGMSQSQITHLFEEFSQVHRDPHNIYGGTGLGLAISRKLCALMGGTILVESTEGVGSTFTIRLPYAPDQFTNAAIS